MCGQGDDRAEGKGWAGGREEIYVGHVVNRQDKRGSGRRMRGREGSFGFGESPTFDLFTT